MTRADVRVEAAVERLGRLADHPAKLVVDVAATSLAMIPLWSHRWLLAAAVAVVPGLTAVGVIATTDRGRSVFRLPLAVQLVRIAALAAAVWAAWTHRPAWLVVALLAGALPLLPWRRLAGARAPTGRADHRRDAPDRRNDRTGRADGQ